jgi:phosphohistidine phosphatase SixA
MVLVRKTLRSEASGKVLWVGHEPWLGEAVGLLIGGTGGGTGGGAVALRKAAVALVEIPSGVRRQGVLRGLIPPEWLALVARAG